MIQPRLTVSTSSPVCLAAEQTQQAQQRSRAMTSCGRSWLQHRNSCGVSCATSAVPQVTATECGPAVCTDLL